MHNRRLSFAMSLSLLAVSLLVFGVGSAFAAEKAKDSAKDTKRVEKVESRQETCSPKPGSRLFMSPANSSSAKSMEGGDLAGCSGSCYPGTLFCVSDCENFCTGPFFCCFNGCQKCCNGLLND